MKKYYYSISETSYIFSVDEDARFLAADDIVLGYTDNALTYWHLKPLTFNKMLKLSTIYFNRKISIIKDYLINNA